ncbi:hypothetical protein [Spirosoma oryzicola]|uniref:hypothetical protein n=1 Tax=Spirosoma oryzicola TaxID=2898794 RepID=UPI001E3BB99B|nr:hypothetical protein [Spirosoma oryzicola]UHG92954.1 hypothetical protein LQ777_08635 [Spirosoma oryzicola]
MFKRLKRSALSSLGWTSYGNKAPNFYITEINGNPGTGIIDITGYNYFVDLVQHIETKTGNTVGSTPSPPTPPPAAAPAPPQEEAYVYPPDYVSLVIMEQNNQHLTPTQHAMLGFFKLRYGRIRV